MGELGPTLVGNGWGLVEVQPGQANKVQFGQANKVHPG